MKKLILLILLIGFMGCESESKSEVNPNVDSTYIKMPLRVYPDYEWTLVDGEIFVVVGFNAEEDFYRGYFLHNQGESVRWNIKSKYIKPYTNTK